MLCLVSRHERRHRGFHAEEPSVPIIVTITPSSSEHSWEVHKKPSNKIHFNFAKPFMGSIFLLLFDAFIKWLDFAVISSVIFELQLEISTF